MREVDRDSSIERLQGNEVSAALRAALSPFVGYPAPVVVGELVSMVTAWAVVHKEPGTDWTMLHSQLRGLLAIKYRVAVEVNEMRRASA